MCICVTNETAGGRNPIFISGLGRLIRIRRYMLTMFIVIVIDAYVVIFIWIMYICNIIISRDMLLLLLLLRYY